MLHLLRTTIIPWIAALTVSLPGVALGSDADPPKIRKKVRKVIVVPKKPAAPQLVRKAVVQPQVLVRPHRAPGYWQPGGYEGRIGAPYYYSVPGGHHGHATNGLRRQTDHGRCQCGHGHGHQYGHYGSRSGWNTGWYGSSVTDPYSYHFGPGYYRPYEHGHYRFPYYSYRRPWYYPGQPVYNRDTNFAW